ncbi:MAG: DUF4147 domain-containing protein [Gemmatimonadota bacterium]
MLDIPRALLTALYRAAVEGAAPFPRTQRAVASWLAARPDLSEAASARVHCIALGKAAPAMFSGAARAIADAGHVIAGGVVVCASAAGQGDLPEHVRLFVGDHPVPGPGSLEAGDGIDDAIQEVGPGDIVVVLLSGGTTALAAAPVAALSQALGDAERAQAHIANLAETLLESGLAIHEMNAIRRRMLRWGAGRLAVALHSRGAAAIPVFAISDVIGDDPSVIGSGPCTADPFDDATFLALLDAHNVRNSLERGMAQFLGIVGGGTVPAVPSPSHPAFSLVQYEVVASNADSLRALASAARASGIDQVIVEREPLAGDAATLGDALARRVLASAARVPRGARALYVAGGEPVVHLRSTFERAWSEDDDDASSPMNPFLVRMDRDVTAETRTDADLDVDFMRGSGSQAGSADEPMRGGRMQLLALAAALAFEEAGAHGNRDVRRVTLLAAGTDGRDGPTDAAGAIVDSAVPALARRAGRIPETDAATGRSYYPLDAAGALLKPGPTGTNVMDIVAVLVDATR